MNKVELTISEINNLPVDKVAVNPAVKAKFAQLYDMLWSHTTGITGEAAAERESLNFSRAIAANNYFAKCTPLSAYIAFVELALSGLSLDAGTRATCYLVPRNNTITFTVSPYGEIVMRIRAGQILSVDNPVIVYENDTFEFGERDGRKYVNYTCRLPHVVTRDTPEGPRQFRAPIIGAFVKIIKTDGTPDYATMFPEDWQRLANYSAKANGPRGANALYSSDGGAIDTGFLQAKLIKHAFRSYPKVRTGKHTMLESQAPDPAPFDDSIYGLPSGEHVDLSTGEIVPAPTEAPVEAPTAVPTGVTVDTGDDDTF